MKDLQAKQTMTWDLRDGETAEVQGSGRKPYVLKNVGGAYSCSCPAWRNQSVPIERRTCKHIRGLRGDAAEDARIGATMPMSGGNAAVFNMPRIVKAIPPPLLLAHTWDGELDPTGWWMSEKLDGVRAYWDGKQFLSRLGNRYHAPDWFTAGLPIATPLDGELWIGRKQFQKTVSIVRRQDASELWREVKYVVFDAPGGRPTQPPFRAFEERLVVCSMVLRSVEFASMLRQELCDGHDHLRRELAAVEHLGGEGLMLRKPGSLYEAGRSMTLLKCKSFADAEARVIAHVPGKGRHKGRLGALAVELENGTKFSVGSGFSDAQREDPPAIGSMITFRYQELSDGGVPRFPTFVRAAVEL